MLTLVFFLLDVAHSAVPPSPQGTCSRPPVPPSPQGTRGRPPVPDEMAAEWWRRWGRGNAVPPSRVRPRLGCVGKKGRGRVPVLL
jgi:hypothetical protein